MVNKPSSAKARQKRHNRIRKHLSGTAQCPRLCVFRSGKHIYAQIIDDTKGMTLAAASTLDKDFDKSLTGKEAAKQVGLRVAKRALDKDISEVLFDRGGYLYHGRVKELADGAREGGLKF